MSSMVDIENIPPSNVVNIPMNIKKNITHSPSIEKTYQKKTQLEHILLRPDTYIGSVESETDKIWIFDDETKRMKHRTINFVPGLYKIFDEILVNAADNKQRDPSMNLLKVNIDKEGGVISVYNNGKGIPVVQHKEHKMYVPELIFGHLLTSSNYDDTKKKTVGGRNGYGAKLTNIFSTEFVVKTVDSKSGFRFHQKFSDNMGKRTKAKVTKSGKLKDFTEIIFKPDFKKFGMEGFDDDIIGLMKKRVYDMAGIYGKGLKVHLNGDLLKIKNFKDYIMLYLNKDVDIVYEKVNDRWEVAVAMSDGHFQQISFVNTICTIKGGKHVNYLTDQIGKKLVTYVKKKNKKVSIKAHHVKNHLWVFVNALINNPAFDSQTKNTLTTNKSNFGSTCVLGDRFMKKVADSGVIANILSWAEFKQSKDLKKGDGKRRGRLTGIPKLEDANNAGKKGVGKNCTLILTEGDSAKALAVSGFSIVGRDNYGVFPLKGKLLNVREASHSQMINNKEISSLKQIIGLQQGKVYENVDSLRYGHVMVMTDQDHDGSHIKGLLINFFQYFWPSLLKIPGFLIEFITPIVKVSKNKGRISQSFYTIPEYEVWKKARENNNGKGWKIKYYKGLGTSTATEAKEYFGDLGKHQIDFHPLDDDDEKMVELAFGKKLANARKNWMTAFVAGTYLDMNISHLKYTEFFQKEFILFSRANNVRAIPSLVDGLKPGQRKILFSCFKRKLVKEIKVAQLVGYVSENSAYHHGEASLAGTIINLAQNFVGSNNINYLYPSGQFGTRDQGGKEHSSPRYIFTYLSPITRFIFHEDDDYILKNNDDDGLLVEPEWYCPIIPCVLLNGAAGIGTGWSTNIPSYNPRDLVTCMKQLIETSGAHVDNIVPWTNGWKGTMIPNNDRTKYLIEGLIEKVDDTTVLISELPIQKWTSDYREKVLEKYLEAGKIKDFRNDSGDDKISFTVFMEPNALLQAEAEGLINFFKLTGNLNLTNMMMFSPNGMEGSGNVKRFHSAEDVMKKFYEIRIFFYHKRKTFLTDKLVKELNMLEDRVRFILAVIAEEFEIRNRPKTEILNQLVDDGYRMFQNDAKEPADDEEDEGDEISDMQKLTKGYNYLLSMPLWSLTLEKVEALKKKKEEKQEELDILCNTTPEELWVADLDRFLEELEKFDRAKEIEANKGRKLKKKHTKKIKQKKKDDDDDDYVPGGGKRNKRKPKGKGTRDRGRSKAKASVKSEVKVKSEMKEGSNIKKEGSNIKKERSNIKKEESNMKKEVSEMISDICISGSDGGNPANQGKKKESSDVDELPEISDDDFVPPGSKIAILANEMEQKTFISRPPILEEGKTTPKKKKKGRTKRKKQSTPTVTVKEEKKVYQGEQDQPKKTKGRGNRKQRKPKNEAVQEVEPQEGKYNKCKDKERSERKAPKKKQSRKKVIKEEDEWEQEKVNPLQSWREDLPVPPRSTKRPSRRRKVVSYADLDEFEGYDDFE